MGGHAKLVAAPAEQEKISSLLLQKFPEAADYESGDKAVGLAFFRIEPTVISLFDYKKGFGNTELVEV